ncbi:MAG: Lrp/AsnC family transcriptional regulator [Verrucomicrobia bacterium]|nr:Lrp/AsnC family transcriptional regulator [Verrucomicrobiota bacterium]
MDPLLHLLQRDARATPADLAAQLNLDADEVQRRIAAFEADGTILGYQAVIDHERVGDGGFVTAVIEVKVTPEREGGFDRLAERIAGFAQVRACYLMSGAYDLLVVIDGRSLREVAGFVSEKLSPLGGVVGTATHFRLKAYKENGVLLAKSPAPERLAVTP